MYLHLRDRRFYFRYLGRGVDLPGVHGWSTALSFHDIVAATVIAVGVDVLLSEPSLWRIPGQLLHMAVNDLWGAVVALLSLWLIRKPARRWMKLFTTARRWLVKHQEASAERFEEEFEAMGEEAQEVYQWWYAMEDDHANSTEEEVE